jgi:DNA-binding transcriptional LysR family regulator
VEEITPWRVGFVPGVTPDKWDRSWTEHERASRRWRKLELHPVDEGAAAGLLLAGDLDMALVRGAVDRDVQHYVALYSEVAVVVVAKDHPVTAYDEVALADLAGEPDIAAQFAELDLAMVIETVAAGTGYVIVPMSVARLHGRKDIEFRPVTDAEESPVGLTWLRTNEDPDTQGFVGIVRGRTPRSSR